MLKGAGAPCLRALLFAARIYMSQVSAFAVGVRTEFGVLVHRLAHYMDEFRKELKLFIHVSVARFIVWRELRKRSNRRA